MNWVIYTFGFSSLVTCNIKVLINQQILIKNLQFADSGRESTRLPSQLLLIMVFCVFIISHKKNSGEGRLKKEKVNVWFIEENRSDLRQLKFKTWAVLNDFYFPVSFQKMRVESHEKMREKKYIFHFETTENLGCISRAVLYTFLIETQQWNTKKISKLRKKIPTHFDAS